MLNLVLLAVVLVPHEAALTDRVDIIELNHFYDENGSLVFNQIIFWQWTGERFDVVAWRLVKSDSQIPVKVRGGYVAVWCDGEKLRRVVALYFRESWTQFDVELQERETLPKDKRRGLSKP